MRWIYLHADSHSDSELHLMGILTDSECMDGGRTFIQPTVQYIVCGQIVVLVYIIMYVRTAILQGPRF